MRNHYDILGVSDKDSESEIEKAYIFLKYVFDPERIDTDEDNDYDRMAANRMRKVEDAYETLRDPDRRKAYDRELSRGQRRFGRPGCGGRGCLIPLLLVAALLLIPIYLYTTRDALVQGQLTSQTGVGTRDGSAVVQARFTNNTWIPKYAYVDATLQPESGSDCRGRSGIFESPSTVIVPPNKSVGETVLSFWDQWFGNGKATNSEQVIEHELRLRCWNGERIPTNTRINLDACQLYVGNSRTIADHQNMWRKSAFDCW